MKKEMQEELSRMAVSETSAHAYHEHLSFLLDRVNKKMVSRQDLEDLIGQNPMNIMFDNHRNHAVFMDNVFQLGLFSLLVNIVPWVYRAYCNHGFSANYFPVHLRAWKETLEETFSPETSEPLLRVYDWMLSHHEDFFALSEAPASTNAASSAPESEDKDRLLQALIDGDRRTVLRIGHENAETPQDLKSFYHNLLQPVMYRIGELWEQGEISVSREHLASALANTAVSSQYVRVMSDVEPWKGKILVTAASNEFHVLGAQIIANCLEAEGWEVDYLGANTPSEDLVGYIRDQRPDVVALSVTMPFNLIQCKDIVEHVKKEFQESRPKILLGGLAFATHSELVQRIGGDGYAEDCTQAIELVEQWSEAPYVRE